MPGASAVVRAELSAPHCAAHLAKPNEQVLRARAAESGTISPTPTRVAAQSLRFPSWLPTCDEAAQLGHANMSMPASTMATQLDGVASVTTYRRGERVCGCGRTSDPLHRVVCGAAKIVTVLATGRQQTIDLLLAGDFFVFDRWQAASFLVETLEKSTVIAAYRQGAVRTLITHRPEIGAFLLDVAYGTAMRLQRRMLTLSHLRTTQKVGAFLLEMLERVEEPNADAVTLPVSRYDIADYLGLSVESVSRSMSKLKSRGVIRMLSSRRVIIVDRHALELDAPVRN